MDSQVQNALRNLHAPDRAVQTEAFFSLLAVTDQPVDWAYQVWISYWRSCATKITTCRSLPPNCSVTWPKVTHSNG